MVQHVLSPNSLWALAVPTDPDPANERPTKLILDTKVLCVTFMPRHDNSLIPEIFQDEFRLHSHNTIFDYHSGLGAWECVWVFDTKPSSTLFS